MLPQRTLSVLGSALLCLVLISSSAPLLQARAPAANSVIYVPIATIGCGAKLSVTSKTQTHLWNTKLSTHQAIGEVVNHWPTTVYSVTLTLHVYDPSTGALVETQTHPAFLPAIPPGKASPFKLEWSSQHFDAPADLTASCVSTSEYTYQPLTALPTFLVTSGDKPELHGQVRNDGPQAVDSIVVAATLRTSDGGFEETGGYLADVDLAPGATAAYTITFSGVYTCLCQPPPSTILVDAQGRVVPSE